MPLFVLIGMGGLLRVLRGERNFRRMLIHIGWGFAIMPLSLVMPLPFILFVPFGVFALVYGIGGCIGYSVARNIQERQHPLHP